ncbi:MAG TPA: S8 family serine peptidase [Thermoanaerobaculia bacterium]|jgi:serine protease|nr:S8 family serine peptidase [Thermoanaerobaculia bacterium]
MKRAAFVVLLFIAPLTAFASTPTQAVIVMTKPSTHFAAKSLSAMFDPNISADERDLRELPGINGFAANLTDGEVAALKASGTTISIEPDLERHAFADDVITPGQQTTPYGVNDVNAPAVWPVTRGKSLANGPAIHVAIIDTGIDYHHPELAAVFKEGFNYLSRTADPLDDNGHGSHVAGIIAAANNGAGVVGIASDVDIYSLKVLSACGSGRTTDIIQAVQWVVDKKKEIGGNWIINLSLGSDTASVSEQAQFQAAADAGVLIFAASGNAYVGDNGLAYPAGYPSVVSVGSVDSTNKVSSFSQRGADLKVVAPGELVLSTFTEGKVTSGGVGAEARFAEGFDKDSNPICLSDGPVTAATVFAGTGAPNEYPAGSAGKIALVQRGGTDPADPTGFFFIAKAKYAKAAGAVGVIIINIIDTATNAPRPFVRPALTPITDADVAKVVPLALVSIEDGAALKAKVGSSVSMTFNGNGSSDTYETLNGTSMACPHAVGTAALVWAVSPNSTATNVATVLEQTAKDLGDSGKDTTYGFGLVNAYDAAKMLNPAAFGVGVTPVIGPVHGRMAGRRGH